MNRVRVGFLTNCYAPYKEPLLAELARHVDLHVFYCARAEPNRAWDVEFSGRYAYTIMPGVTLSLRGAYLHVNPGLARCLRRFRPDVLIVGGYSSPTYLLAPYLCRREGIRTILWSGSTDLERRRCETLTRPLKKMLVRQFDGYVAYTTRAAAYLEGLGAPPGEVTVAPVTVDTAFFSRSVPTPGAAAVAGPEVPSASFRWIFAGQLIRRKGGDILIRAFSGLPPTELLLMIGAGPEESAWRLLAEETGCASRVIWLGHRTQGELAALYALADALVLPSLSDPSGNVVNEAMAAGLPVIVSDRVGTDLVEQGRQGFVVPSGEVEALRSAMAALSSDRPLWRRMAGAARERVIGFSIEHEARQFLHAVEKVLRRTPGRQP